MNVPPQFPWLSDARQAGAVISGSLDTQPRDTHKAREEAARTDMIRELDQLLAEIHRNMDAHRAVGGDASNDPHLAALEQRSSQLLSVRQHVESATSLSALAQLRGQVADVTRSTTEVLQTSGSTAAASGSPSSLIATRQLAEAEYHARMTNIERAAAPLVAQSTRLAGEADSMAKRMGLDTSHFTELNDALKRSAAEKRKKGDRIGGMEDETLAAWNTANHWDDIAANAKTDADRQAAERKADEARAAAEKQEQLLRQAVEAKVQRQAANRSFSSPEERDAFIKAKTNDHMKDFQDKKADHAKLKGVSKEQATEYLAAAKEVLTKGNAATAETQEPDSKALQSAPGEKVGLTELPKPMPQLTELAAAAAPLSLDQLGALAKQAVQDSPVKDSGVDVKVAEAPQGLPAKPADPSKAPVQVG